MTRSKLSFVILIQLWYLNSSIAYNILSFSFIPVKSHDSVLTALLKELASRNHNVTVYTVFPSPEQIPNYEEVDINECFTFPSVYQKIPQMRSSPKIESFFRWYHHVDRFTQLDRCVILKNLLKSSKNYDLFIFEPFHMSSLLSIAEYFDIPVIYVFPNVLLPWMASNLGTPANPSYVPTMISGFGPKMSFIERIQNVGLYGTYMVFYYGWLYPVCDVISGKIHDSGVPLNVLESRVALVLTNTHFTLQSNVPLSPNVVQVGGINIKNATAVPKNIEKFINESKHGVVYFCMGSLLRGETFPPEKREAFLYAFSKIPQRVLWKWEGDVLPGKSDNIMISKWMPQRDILAHPNVKLFISHGGLLGTSEAVYEGVPVLGIPIFGDQRTNIKSLEANGAGELLDYNEISKEVVLEKIQRLLNDPKYKENAKLLSDRYRDRPMSPLDTAVYWTEYVIRHKGAPHLRTAAADMPWYQYLLLDVIAFIVAVLVAGLLIIYYTTKFILRAIYGLICGGGAKKGSSKSDKKKRN
ncbi:UDP-glycosyltransferase UGT5-like isoform X34 [Planococcus citri]|uniref:UDP-glycosyltransferase UGT5-like isoform X34 n=1 Tax=Planococcus citri TaxID=170843 RepID=UPI0031F75013